MKFLNSYNYTAVITAQDGTTITQNEQVLAEAATAQLLKQVETFLGSVYNNAKSIKVTFDGPGILANALYFG